MLRLTRIPRWGELGQLGRASLYLRGSLYLLVWGIPVVGLVAVGRLREQPAYLAGVGAVLVLLVAIGTLLLREAIRIYPAAGPLPRAGLTAIALVVVGVVLVARLLEPEAGGPAVLLACLVLAMTVGGFTDTRLTWALVASFVVLPLAATSSVRGAAIIAVYGVFLVFTVRSSLWLYHVMAELDRARTATSALAVAEERLRFSRDVHDVLGRHLSTIAVQAELAATLARRGDERAAEKMLEVRAGAHDALREARELARGYRETDLDTEVAGARSLLRSAGIRAEVDVDGLPERWREPAAWVVREAVTNVLRHSTAQVVEISWDGTALRVADDGTVGPDVDGSAAAGGGAVGGGAVGGGAGLRGLAERLEPLGARLATGAGPDGGFAVTMTTDGATDGAAPGRAPARTEEPA